MSARFSSVLIANRGEIACRVIRAARAEGLRAIAVFSDADADALHVRLADAAVRIGPPPAAQSYLSIKNLIAAARTSGAEAVHPGYGFLAESAEFAESCVAAGLAFVGPPAAAIRAMGSKSAAKALMEKAGVPTAPGYHGDDQSFQRFAAEASRIGYPVMVKASAGGGGRGMRIVHTPEELAPALRSAAAEAQNAFGDGRLLLEKALVAARHVEVQVFGDANGAIVHLGERDCSIQRRHQKLIEEAPSPGVSAALRAAIGEAAVRVASAVAYEGAGTVEFLVDGNDRFYFLEMNTRIQVEHPVTEAVTGVDLVRLQFQVAQGRPLPFGQADIALRGHAIEARLYAEDPSAGFAPSTGRIADLRLDAAAGIRIDCGVESGATVTPYYDSLLAKIVAFGATRDDARRRLIAALRGAFVAGVATNRDFLVELLEGRAFVEGRATTDLIAAAPPPARESSREAVALASLLFVERGGAAAPTAGWRESPLRLSVDGADMKAAVRRQGDEWLVVVDGETLGFRLVSGSPGAVRFERNGVVRSAAYARDGDDLWLDLDGVCRRFADRTYAPPERKDARADGAVRSPVSGIVVAAEAKTGDHVRRGQALATVEAMKMQYSILAPIDGVIAHAAAAAGAQTQARSLLFVIVAHGES
jgi:geranyl-CoA carboxylase alpha subunit